MIKCFICKITSNNGHINCRLCENYICLQCVEMCKTCREPLCDNCYINYDNCYKCGVGACEECLFERLNGESGKFCYDCL